MRIYLALAAVLVLAALAWLLFRDAPADAPVEPAGAARSADESVPAAQEQAGGRALEDGEHFGYLRVDVAGRAIEFDEAGWLSGEAANRAARAEYGADAPNGFYIQDLDPGVTYRLPVSPGARLTKVDNAEPGPATLVELAGHAYGYVHPSAPSVLATILVEGGTAVRIDEAYTP